MTVLHAGGKFDNKSYKVSGGLHGVGVSVVNALSETLDLEIWRDGQVYRQRYERGEPLSALQVIGKTKRRGTKVTFKPDGKVFETVEYSFDTLAHRLRELAFLNAGVLITLDDERIGKSHAFRYEGGIRSFVEFINTNRTIVNSAPIYMQGTRDGIDAEISLQWNDGYADTVYSFANNINTQEGGTHLSGFRSALTRTVNTYANRNNLAPDLKESISGDRYPRRPVGGGQRQGSASAVRRADQDQAGQHGGAGHRRGDRQRSPRRVPGGEPRGRQADRPQDDRCGARSRAARKARELVRRKGALDSSALPGQAGRLPGARPGAERAVHRRGRVGRRLRQAGPRPALPGGAAIKGKILNVERARFDKMLGSDEIKTMIAALGCGIGQEDFDLSRLRYHRIVIMTDADVDGSHIRTLLLTFFYRQMRALIEQGHIYIAQPPLYRAKRGRKEHYIKDDAGLDIWLIRRAVQARVLHLPESGRTFAGEELEAVLHRLMAFQKMLAIVERRGPRREVVQRLLERGVHDRTFFTDRERVAELARDIEAPACNVAVSPDEEHNCWSIAIDDRTNGFPRRQTVGVDFVETAEYRELFARHGAIEAIRGPMEVAASKEADTADNDSSEAPPPAGATAASVGSTDELVEHFIAAGRRGSPSTATRDSAR